MHKQITAMQSLSFYFCSIRLNFGFIVVIWFSKFIAAYIIEYFVIDNLLNWVKPLLMKFNASPDLKKEAKPTKTFGGTTTFYVYFRFETMNSVFGLAQLCERLFSPLLPSCCIEVSIYYIRNFTVIYKSMIQYYEYQKI